MTPDTKKAVGIHFGALSDSIHKQLKQQGWKFDPAQVKIFEDKVDCILKLRFADLLSDKETDRLYGRLHKQIVAHVKKMNP